MKLLRVGYAHIIGESSTQRLFMDKECGKHKSLSEYLGFFGFGFTDEIPHEIASRDYIKFSVTSDMMKDLEYASFILDELTSAGYALDQGNLLSLYRAMGHTQSLRGFRWHKTIINGKPLCFSIVEGFDLDCTPFLCITFERLESVPASLSGAIQPCNSEWFADMFEYSAYTQPKGDAWHHIYAMLYRLLAAPEDVSDERYTNKTMIPRSVGEPLRKTLADEGISNPSTLYLQTLAEALEKLY